MAKAKSPCMLAHGVVRTGTFKTMVDCYKKFLGVETSYENEILSFLRYGEEHNSISIAGIPDIGHKDKGVVGMHYIAFALDTLDDLALVY
jgi:catechol-2,3-dioxygenase